MATTCPYCNTDVKESLIEAEDGCCPECGALIGASNSFFDDEEGFDDYEDDETQDVFGEFDDDDGDDAFAHDEYDDDDIFSDDDIGDEFDEDYEDDDDMM